MKGQPMSISINKVSIAAIATAASMIAIAMLPSPASAGTPAPASSCNYDNNAVVVFSETVLLSHDTGGAIYDRDINVPAGTYDIETLSADLQHPNDPIPGQTVEQWYFELRTAAGELLYTSPTTTDLPDADQTIVDMLDTNVVLSSTAERIRYIHPGFPENVSDPADLIYNSVVPSCVSFIPVPVVVVIPVCTVTPTVDTDNSYKFVLSLDTNQDGDVTVDWGDGTDVETYALTDMIMHTYAKEGTYTITTSVVEASCNTEVEIVAASTPGVLGDSITVEDEEASEPQVLPASTGTLAATGINTVASMLIGAALAATVAFLSRSTFVVDKIKQQ